MYNKEFYIASLIAGHLRNELNVDQLQELSEWRNMSKANQERFDQLVNEVELRSKIRNYGLGSLEPIWEKTKQRVHDAAALNNSKAPLKIFTWTRVGAIAAVLALISLGVWLFDISLLPGEDKAGSELIANDIAPGKNTATLTLANGKTIKLSDTKTGVAIKNAILSYTDGSSLTDLQSSVQERNSAMLTVKTPRGGTYQVTLPDGSKVWLNAASSINFPATFNNLSFRKVELIGEGYFEIIKDRAHPFVVESRGQQVEVFGTHFNVNAYEDEPTVATALLEGSVKVSDGTIKRMIKPGEQALYNGKKIEVEKANVESITDWKDGEFSFNDVDFKTAMRKIERWYNVEFIYDPSLPREMTTGGWISRNNKLSSVLKLIESSGLVHFKIAGKKVYVTKLK
jgi:hypothetical protein